MINWILLIETTPLDTTQINDNKSLRAWCIPGYNFDLGTDSSIDLSVVFSVYTDKCRSCAKTGFQPFPCPPFQIHHTATMYHSQLLVLLISSNQ